MPRRMSSARAPIEWQRGNHQLVFDYVAGEAAKGIAATAMAAPVPVIFGVLTTNTIEQAVERAGTKAGNKGADAAISALEMVSLYRQLKEAAGNG